MEKRSIRELKPASTPNRPRMDEGLQKLHHLHNNFAAIRLWLTMLEVASCARCRRSQADGLRAIDRNLQQAETVVAERLRAKAPAARRSRRGTRKIAR